MAKHPQNKHLRVVVKKAKKAIDIKRRKGWYGGYMGDRRHRICKYPYKRSIKHSNLLMFL